MAFAELSDGTLSAFIGEVYKHTGITMDTTKRAMLIGRLRRRARALDLTNFETYLAYLQSNRAEVDLFVDAVTTNKTSMFRTASMWRDIVKSWLPEWNGLTLRAWSAACSTGKEAASLAVLLQEHAASKPDFRWRIDASDISPEMVEKATQQTFAEVDVVRDAKNAPWLDVMKYFNPAGDGQVQLNADLRRQIRFFRHNLHEPSKQAPYDLLFVRNVIIYFSSEDKQRVIRNAYRALKPGGLLVIGESESLLDGLDGLEGLGHCLYRKST